MDINTLRLIIGSSPSKSAVSYKDFVISKRLDTLTKLNIVVFADTPNNYAKIFIYCDDKRFDASFTYNYSVEPINKYTLVYTNLAATSSNIIVNEPRIDFALDNLFKDTTVFRNFCDGATCSQCYSQASGDTCLACNNDTSVMFNGICRPKSYATPNTNSKQRTTLKAKRQDMMKK
jgi:hypothetical protein